MFRRHRHNPSCPPVSPAEALSIRRSEALVWLAIAQYLLRDIGVNSRCSVVRPPYDRPIRP